jgi:hypothetical protein
MFRNTPFFDPNNKNIRKEQMTENEKLLQWKKILDMDHDNMSRYFDKEGFDIIKGTVHGISILSLCALLDNNVLLCYLSSNDTEEFTKIYNDIIGYLEPDKYTNILKSPLYVSAIYNSLGFLNVINSISSNHLSPSLSHQPEDNRSCYIIYKWYHDATRSGLSILGHPFALSQHMDCTCCQSRETIYIENGNPYDLYHKEFDDLEHLLNLPEEKTLAYKNEQFKKRYPELVERRIKHIVENIIKNDSLRYP